MRIVKTPSTKLGAKGGQWLMQYIETALDKDTNYFKFMRNLRNLAEGKHWENIKGVKKEDIKMVINLAHAHIRSLVPTLFFQNPSVDCAPTAPQHAGKEKTWNGIINNTLDKTNFKEEIKKAILDAVIYPEAVVKDVVNRPAVSTDKSTEASSSGPTVWLSKGAPIHVRIAPTQLIVDHLSPDRDVENARFIAVRYRKPLHELKVHPIYGKNIKRDVSSKKPISTGNMVSGNNLDLDDWENNKTSYRGTYEEELVTIYEVWIHQLISSDGEHKLYQQMCVLMEDQDEPIRELESWESVMGEGFNQFPVTRIVLNKIPDTNPQSELGVWQNMQMALNWLMSRITQLVENDRQIYAVDESKLKAPQKARKQFTSGKTREWIEVTADNAITLLQPTFVGRDNYSLVSLMEKFIQQVSGVGQNRRAGSGIRTATEASLIDRGTELKTDEKTDSVMEFLKKILTKNAMMTMALVKNEVGVRWVYRIGGDVGAVNWIDWTADDINWLPDIRIRPNSFRKMDSLQEMQKYAGILQQAITLFQLYGPTIRVDLLFGRMLESAGIYDADKIIGSQDKEALLQTIELAGIIAGAETPVTESQNHIVHKQIIDAFKQSLIGQQILSTIPEAADRLAQHEAMHDQFIMELQQKAAQQQLSAGDPFAAASAGVSGNAQSEAGQFTQGDRTAVAPVPQGNGEFA